MGVLRLCRHTNVDPGPLTATQKLRVQDISLTAITGRIPTSYFMNPFLDTSKCGLIYYFCQYFNLSMMA